MAKEKEEKKSKKCFLITPIGGKNSEEFQKLGALEKNVYNIVLEEFGYDLVIAHKIDEAGSIGDQVFKSILSADLIIANMTNLNANVMYEVAVAHSFGIPTVMISENGTKLPFDLISERTIFYDDSIEGCGLLISELRNKIEHLSKDGNFDNPVYRIIERNALQDKVITEDDKESLITNTLFDLQDQIYHISRSLNKFVKTENTKKRGSNRIQTKLDIEENSFSFGIGEYGKIVISEAHLLDEKYIMKIVNVARDLADGLERLPSIFEISSETGLSLSEISNIKMVTY